MKESVIFSNEVIFWDNHTFPKFSEDRNIEMEANKP